MEKLNYTKGRSIDCDGIGKISHHFLMLNKVREIQEFPNAAFIFREIDGPSSNSLSSA